MSISHERLLNIILMIWQFTWSRSYGANGKKEDKVDQIMRLRGEMAFQWEILTSLLLFFCETIFRVPKRMIFRRCNRGWWRHRWNFIVIAFIRNAAHFGYHIFSATKSKCDGISTEIKSTQKTIGKDVDILRGGWNAMTLPSQVSNNWRREKKHIHRCWKQFERISSGNKKRTNDKSRLQNYCRRLSRISSKTLVEWITAEHG